LQQNWQMLEAALAIMRAKFAGSANRNWVQHQACCFLVAALAACCCQLDSIMAGYSMFCFTHVLQQLAACLPLA
jgi:hypothetical protein